MSEFTPTYDREVTLPSPDALRKLAQVAFAYAATLERGMVVNKDNQLQEIYYLKDFRLKNNQRIGRVARYARIPALVVGEDQFEVPNGEPDHYSLYLSERVETEIPGMSEEAWQAFGYRWTEEDGILRARRWIEQYPSHGERRQMAVSTAADVDQLLDQFRDRLLGVEEAA